MHCYLRGINGSLKHFARIFQGEYGDRPLSEPSRAGDVLRIPHPVTCTYDHPWERVLFNQARDANPFFHLFEALWMLAGRNDVAPLAYFNSQISEIASDDGKTFNGAYGYRWRHANVRKNLSPYHNMDGLSDKQRKDLSGNSSNGIWGNTEVDQLQVITDHLRANKNSRRAVLQMWNVEDDLLKIDHTKDVCCNTCIYFTVREALRPENPSSDIKYNYLDMVVCNRSNDLTWGMLGANFVHFTILQEYMAAKIGVEMGLYHHFTSNLHVYTSRWNPTAILADETPDYYTKMGRNQLVPLVRDPVVFDKELFEFIDIWKTCDSWEEPFLADVALPMFRAFEEHKRRDYARALTTMTAVESEDWRLAGIAWIEKRQRQYEQECTTHLGLDLTGR